MRVWTERLDAYDKRGFFTFGREMLKVLEQIVTTYSEEDVQQLGANIVGILDTVRNITQPNERTTWEEPDDTFAADVKIDVRQTDTGSWNAKVRIWFENPHVRITDPGTPDISGHMIRINATAMLHIVTPTTMSKTRHATGRANSGASMRAP